MSLLDLFLYQYQEALLLIGAGFLFLACVKLAFIIVEAFGVFRKRHWL